MGKSLRVLDDGSWETVQVPYIVDGGSWKTVHKVWIVNGGAWKESHITPYTEYDLGTGGVSATTSGGTWTVPANTRYARVTIIGYGGGGGTSNRTNSYHDQTAGANSGNPPWTSSVSTADGGHGGSGGKITAILEVKPGNTYTYNAAFAGDGDGGAQDDSLPNQEQSQGGSAYGNLYLRRNNYDIDRGLTPPPAATWNPPNGSFTVTSTYTQMSGKSGVRGSDISFTGDGQVIKANGGIGGGGGKLFVSSWYWYKSSLDEYQAKYTLTVTQGSDGANGTGYSSGSKIVFADTVTGGGGSGGSAGTASSTAAYGGGDGTGGSIQIETYQGI